MVYEEKTISTERIYEGAILNLRKDKVYVKGDKTSYREIVEHNGGVAIAALTDEGKLVMVRQFRKAAEKVMFEVPAGKIEPGEEPEVTAVRELKEETGYTAAACQYLTSFYSSVGYSTEKIYIYLATGLVPGETHFDENEAIDREEYHLSELRDMISDGRIEDGKTMLAILLTGIRTGK